MQKKTVLKQCMDLYIYVSEFKSQFKLIRPLPCPSFLLTKKGQKYKFLNTHSCGFLFVGLWVYLGSMNKYLFIVLLVRVGFEQNVQLLRVHI